jgi:diguanylate cyclase (GGDEF)-like protein/PAS domain S-box-containing protein
VENFSQLSLKKGVKGLVFHPIETPKNSQWSMSVSPSIASSLKKPRGYEWLFLIVIALVALSVTAATLIFWNYATNRREVVRQLERLQSMANYQASLEWQAITVAMSGSLMNDPRLLGEAQFAREAIYEHWNTLSTLEKQGERFNRYLGFEDTKTVLAQLEEALDRYESASSATFGQLNTGMLEMVQFDRQFENVEFNYLQETITQVSERNQKLAERATKISTASVLLSVALILLAATWIVFRLTRFRARRTVELEKERHLALAESETRFRALVQNASDMIVVLEPDSKVRYASPATQSILGVSADTVTEKSFWSEVLKISDDNKKWLEQSRGEALEIATRHVNGEKRELELRVQNHQSNPELRGIIVNAHDITQRKRLEHDLRHQALHDPLTDLPNRRYFSQQLEQALKETFSKVAVLFVDLEGIKLVNDSYGHDRGDLLLIEASRRIRDCLRTEDTLGRLGGDELVAVLPSIQDETGVAEVAKRILKTLVLPFKIEGQEIFLTPSIGASISFEKATPSDLVRQAGIAMYQAKRELKGLLFFESAMGEEAPERLRLESDMRRGIEQNEFTVYYQPKVDLQTGKVVSLEALVRWQHPERGFVSPAKFIPFAEETGLIEPLGKIVLETACREAVGWQKEGEMLVMAVNLSAIQFRNPNLVAEIEEVLIRTGLPPHALELEITESAVLGDVNATIATLEQLKALGIRLAIDDFGTGYSNLGHLRKFPVDVLKIDQSFVRGMSGTLDDTPIVEAVISLAKALELHVVAEGVETVQQMNQLKTMGCDLGQGYYFAKPLPSQSITEMLNKSVIKS